MRTRLLRGVFARAAAPALAMLLVAGTARDLAAQTPFVPYFGKLGPDFLQRLGQDSRRGVQLGGLLACLTGQFQEALDLIIGVGQFIAERRAVGLRVGDGDG